MDFQRVKENILTLIQQALSKKRHMTAITMFNKTHMVMLQTIAKIFQP